MALQLIQYSQTQTTVTVYVSGARTDFLYKRFEIYLDGLHVDSKYSNDLSFVVERLSPGQSYSVYVKIYYYDPSQQYEGQSNTITITTSGGSGPTPASDPYYTISYTDTAVTVQIHNVESGSWFHYELVDADGNQIYNSGNTHITNNPFTLPVTLTPSTSYGIDRVQYYSSSANELVRIRFTDENWQAGFVTESGSSPSGDDGYAWIFTGSRWQKAKPYIFDGSQWRPATPYIFDGTSWRKCGG